MNYEEVAGELNCSFQFLTKMHTRLTHPWDIPEVVRILLGRLRPRGRVEIWYVGLGAYWGVCFCFCLCFHLVLLGDCLFFLIFVLFLWLKIAEQNSLLHPALFCLLLCIYRSGEGLYLFSIFFGSGPGFRATVLVCAFPARQ